MSFGLKNAGVTYRRMMTKVFSEQLGKSIEVYIDDMRRMAQATMLTT